MAAFVLFCLPCFVWFDRHSNPKDNTMDDTMLSPFFQLQTLRTDQLITPAISGCRSFLLGCFVFDFGFCVFWFALFLVLVVFFLFGIVTANFVLVLHQFSF